MSLQYEHMIHCSQNKANTSQRGSKETNEAAELYFHSPNFILIAVTRRLI